MPGSLKRHTRILGDIQVAKRGVQDILTGIFSEQPALNIEQALDMLPIEDWCQNLNPNRVGGQLPKTVD